MGDTIRSGGKVLFLFGSQRVFRNVCMECATFLISEEINFINSVFRASNKLKKGNYCSSTFGISCKGMLRFSDKQEDQ